MSWTSPAPPDANNWAILLQRESWLPAQHSENRQRIEQRACPTGKTQRRRNQHKLPATFLVADCRDVLEIEAVSADHAHGANLQSMNRISEAFNVTGYRFAISIRKEGRHLPLVQKRNRIAVQTGFTFAVVSVVPGPEFKAAPVVSGSENEDVPLSQRDALRPFTLLQFLSRNCLPGL